MLDIALCNLFKLIQDTVTNPRGSFPHPFGDPGTNFLGVMSGIFLGML